MRWIAFVAVCAVLVTETPEEIHEWIHNGVTRKKSASVTWRADRDRGVLKMPAFKGRMSEKDMADLVAYVMAASGMPSRRTRSWSPGCSVPTSLAVWVVLEGPGSWKTGGTIMAVTGRSAMGDTTQTSWQVARWTTCMKRPMSDELSGSKRHAARRMRAFGFSAPRLVGEGVIVACSAGDAPRS